LDERSRREPITDVTAPRRATAIAVALALAAFVVAVVGWMAAGPADVPPSAVEPPPAAASSLAPPAAPAHAVEVAEPPRPPSPADLDAWLAAVHQTDPTRALDWATRHALLDRLEASKASARIDRRLQLALDLRQVADAPRPCTALAETLDAIATASDPWFADALAGARVPDPATAPHAGQPPDRACDGLAERLAELRARTPPAPAVAIAEPKPKRVRPSEPKAATPSSSGVRPGPPRAPDPARHKLEGDELRPFRK
jgi:hypothetical protein